MSGGRFLSLGAGAVLAGLSAGLSGCVVPVAPTWSDPPANVPPTISTANPPVGSVLGGSDGGNPVEVTVALADQNTDDTLYLRWIVDYPPYAPDATWLAREDRQPGGNAIVRTPESFAPECTADHLSRATPSHRLLLAVSDRPFANDDPTRPDAVSTGYLVEAVWPFFLSCQ